MLSRDGRRRLFKGWLLVATLAAGATIVNGFSAQAEHSHAALWEPWVWEGSSSFMMILVGWLPGLAILVGRTETPKPAASAWARLAIVNAVAVLLFSGLHVVGMLALRKLIYAAAGGSYDYGPAWDRFVYEFRKDLLTYAIFAALFWLSFRRQEALPTLPVEADFDILDGGRLIRTPVGEILAAGSAGNYVEFLLVDGRRPLMRTTLAAVQAELEPRGFIRTHRSWLVNPARLTGLKPLGSGDWSVELGGAKAPLSRRYPEALQKLKRHPPASSDKRAALG